jgi:mevalonate kinase
MTIFSASAPASLMLVGEHAVLWGSPCLVAAVDQRLTVVLEPRSDNQVVISSDYGTERMTLSDIKLAPESVHRFVMATVCQYKDYLLSGFDLTITSCIPDRKGFGSSAAVIVATQEVLLNFVQLTLTIPEKVVQGRTIVQKVQGYGSGADIAAALLGGVVFYQVDPLLVEPSLPDGDSIPLVAVYCGYKTPTADVIQKVEERRKQHPHLFRLLTEQASQLTKVARSALIDHDLDILGSVFEEYEMLMQIFGVEDIACHLALNYLRRQPNIKGAKISGSGLGDCVIGCGTLQESAHRLSLALLNRKMEILPVHITAQGVCYESV